MRERIASAIADRLYKNPGLIALVVVILVGLSGWQMSKLTINYNQLELIPQDLPSVLATKRMFNLAGGYGNLFIALRGKDISQPERPTMITMTKAMRPGFLYRRSVMTLAIRSLI